MFLHGVEGSKGANSRAPSVERHFNLPSIATVKQEQQKVKNRVGDFLLSMPRAIKLVVGLPVAAVLLAIGAPIYLAIATPIEIMKLIPIVKNSPIERPLALAIHLVSLPLLGSSALLAWSKTK